MNKLLSLSPVLAALLMGASGPVMAQAGGKPAATTGGTTATGDVDKLVRDRGCMACHAIDKKMVGPAFKDVAAKYKTEKDAVNKLVTKVMKGGSGVWGAIPMPPQALSDEEAHKMVDWVLKQK